MGIQLTGRMRAVGPDGTVESSDLAGRQGRLVLASLALTEQPVAREVLADRIWGQDPPKAWERDLSAVVSKLRGALIRAGLGGADVIRGESGTYQLQLAGDHDVDIRSARSAVAQAIRARNEGRSADAVAAASAAAEIAGRAFLPGEDADWVDAVRSELGQLRLRALEVAAEGQAADGRFADAIASLEALLEEDPYRESAVRALMGVHLDMGSRAEAIRVYERTRERLADELGVDPSPETEQLHLAALRAATPRGPGVHGATSRAAPGPPPAGAPPTPEVRYARSGRVNIAYQVLGDGPVDLVLVPGWISNLEVAWQEPNFAAFLRGLAASCRLILFDKRGTGLSDPIPLDEPPPMDVRMDDVSAVMDAAGSERAALFGFSEGGAMSLLFAATYPERTLGLMLWGSWCRQLRDDAFPLGWTREEGRRRFLQPLRDGGHPSASWFVPSRDHDADFQAWFSRYARQSASPGMAIALLRANARMDVRDVLPSVRVPTLVLHRTRDVLVEVGQGRYIADHVPGARMVEFAGRDHWPWFGDDGGTILAEMRDFLGRLATSPAPVQHVLATLVSVRGGAPGDAAEVVARHRGILVEDAADELLVRFDGPGRAVECAKALVAGAPGARAGVHTGEIALEGSDVHGMAVDVARAVCGRAVSDQVLVTRTVTDLVAGSPLTFEHLDPATLADLGSWELARAT